LGKGLNAEFSRSERSEQEIGPTNIFNDASTTKS
jgi:hypothetical protein